jgi:hypothetical protein
MLTGAAAPPPFPSFRFIMDTDLSRHMLTGVKPEWLRQFLLRTVAIWVGRALGKDIPQASPGMRPLRQAPRPAAGGDGDAHDGHSPALPSIRC